jgi:hypothetical protein
VVKPTLAKCPQGHPELIVAAVLTAIEEVYEQEADIYLDELVYWLSIQHDILISTSTLWNTLKTVGLTRKKLHVIAKEWDTELIEQFWPVIWDNTLEMGEELVLMDKMSKNDHDTAQQYGRSRSGTWVDCVDNFVWGDRYSMAGALSLGWYITVRVVPHDTAQQYGRSRSGTWVDCVDNFVWGDRYSMAGALSLGWYITVRVVPSSFDSELFYQFVQEHVLCWWVFPLNSYTTHTIRTDPTDKTMT